MAPTVPISVAPERRTASQNEPAENPGWMAARLPDTSAVARVENRALTWYSGSVENSTSSGPRLQASILIFACSIGKPWGSTAPLAGPVVPDV